MEKGIIMADILEPSILKSAMKWANVDSDDTSDASYAEDILRSVNSWIVALTQVGIGPPEGFQVNDDTTTWEDFLGIDPRFNLAKDYIFYKVKLAFDPPSAAIIESYKELAAEALWRSGAAAELIRSE